MEYMKTEMIEGRGESALHKLSSVSDAISMGNNTISRLYRFFSLTDTFTLIFFLIQYDFE